MFDPLRPKRDELFDKKVCVEAFDRRNSAGNSGCGRLPRFRKEHETVYLGCDLCLLCYVYYFSFQYSGFNFFEASIASSLAFLGCLLLGITFLQLCRRST